MKTFVLLITGMLMSLAAVNASEIHSDKNKNHLDNTKPYRYAEPIMFVERGVEFLIFPNGTFDYNTIAKRDTQNNTCYKYGNSRRSSVNRSHSTSSRYLNYSNENSRGISIIRDRSGKVRSIGHVYINYDRSGKITRAGSIFMNYSRGHGTLNKVGGLSINYNHWGEIVNTHGRVNRYEDYCNFCGVNACKSDHFHGNKNKDKHHNKDHRDDNDSKYYYKQNDNTKKHNQSKR
jgi:hypothetical protein